MLARIAQELFWLGRDMTRAEHTARMLDGAFHADVAGTPGERGVTLSWSGVLAVIGAKPPAPGEEAAEGAAAEAAHSAPPGILGRGEIAPLLTLDTEITRPRVVSCVYRRSRAGTNSARRDLRSEMWEALNSFYASRWGRLRPGGGTRDRAVLRLPGGQGALRAVLGGCWSRRCCVTRARYVPGCRRAHRGGRHGPADAATVAIPVGEMAGAVDDGRRRLTKPRRSRCCTRSAACRHSAGTCARGPR